MNSGKIVSRVGDQAVAELTDQNIPEIGKPAYCGTTKIGAVFDIIGRKEKPYIVIRTRSQENLIGKQVQFK